MFLGIYKKKKISINSVVDAFLKHLWLSKDNLMRYINKERAVGNKT